jgi:hypothetical protein
VGADENNLYEIPPAVPPIPAQWSVANPILDTQNGVFDTTAVAPGITYDQAAGTEEGSDQGGKFEIMLELFDTAGHRVDIASLGIKYFVPTSTSLAGTIDTVDASTLMPSLVAGSQMIVTVHVDNNPTYAEIDAPMITAAPRPILLRRADVLARRVSDAAGAPSRRMASRHGD